MSPPQSASYTSSRTASSESPSLPSNIRASVHWRNPSVYAGEDLECIITFTNIAIPENAAITPTDPSATAHANGQQSQQHQTIAGGGRGGQHKREGSFASAPPTAAQSRAMSHSRRSSIAQQQQQQPQHQRRLSRTTSLSTTAGIGPGGRAGSALAGGAAQTTISPVVGHTGRAGTQHRPTLSLNMVAGSSTSNTRAVPGSARTPKSAPLANKGHGRSLSILSLGSEPLTPGSAGAAGGPKRMPSAAAKHGRSASLQMMTNSQRGTAMSSVAAPLPRVSSPLVETRLGSNTTPPPPTVVGGAGGDEVSLPVRPARRRPGTQSAETTPQLGEVRQSSLRRGGRMSPGHHPSASWTTLPPSATHQQRSTTPGSSFTASQHSELRPTPIRTNSLQSRQQRSISPRPPDGWTSADQPARNPLNPISRVMSESSVAGTPRTSSEIYSNSNHSDETLTSEVPSQYAQNGRSGGNGGGGGGGSKYWPPSAYYHSRRRSPSARPAQPETLMMGYVQTMGTFVLDGSLVNGAPFEEVKRKGVQGGGGVVGVERSSSRSSGMFGAFGWGNLGESLGGLLGGDDRSSLAQMKAVAGSKSVPLLSTPQNLLFVDLRLAPGESASFSYRFPLPRGLPPSHRGRAIKVQYHLSLGVQRPEGQAVRHVEVPFRVLGSYNSRGEMLGHDLMSPYIMLRDAARSKTIAASPSVLGPSSLFASLDKSPDASSSSSRSQLKQGLQDFLRYTERLLEPRRKESVGALASPSAAYSSRKESLSDAAPFTTKEAIDLAIMRANYIAPSSGNGTSNNSNNPDDPSSPSSSNDISGPQPSPQPSPELSSGNRFNIARGGQPIAVLTLLRPTFRLGEAVTGVIDFTIPPSPPQKNQNAQHPQTYALTLDLESTERIDPSLALRSAASVHRVTRKSYASARENCLFARQVAFSLNVPHDATPGFETTGVSLVWRLRVEFVTARQQQPQLKLKSGVDDDDEAAGGNSNSTAASSSSSSSAAKGSPSSTSHRVQDGDGLLELLGRDERSTVMIAKERLLAESFEIAVPLKILGVPGPAANGDGAVDGDGGVTGLVV